MAYYQIVGDEAGAVPTLSPKVAALFPHLTERPSETRTLERRQCLLARKWERPEERFARIRDDLLAALHVTAEDLATDSIYQAETLRLNGIGWESDAQNLTTVLVNMVHRTSFVRRGEERLSRKRSASLALLQAQLLDIGIYRLKKPSMAQEFRLSYRSPYVSTHDVNPLDLTMQETATRSIATGHILVQLTSLLLEEREILDVRSRARENLVFTTYIPFHVDIYRFAQAHPAMAEKPAKFDNLILKCKELGKKCLIVISTGIVVCVGAKSFIDAFGAFKFGLPLVYEMRSSVPVKGTVDLTAIEEGLAVEKASKRRRED